MQLKTDQTMRQSVGQREICILEYNALLYKCAFFLEILVLKMQFNTYEGL